MFKYPKSVISVVLFMSISIISSANHVEAKNSALRRTNSAFKRKTKLMLNLYNVYKKL